MLNSISDLKCAILKRYFYNSTDRLKEEKTLIRQFKTDTHRPEPRLTPSYTIHALSQMIHLSLNPHSLDVHLSHAYSGHSYFTQQRSFVNFS